MKDNNDKKDLNKGKYIDFGDLPSNYLVNKGKELIIQMYSMKSFDEANVSKQVKSDRRNSDGK